MEGGQYRPGRREAAGMARDYCHGLGLWRGADEWQLTATIRGAKLMYGQPRLARGGPSLRVVAGCQKEIGAGRRAAVYRRHETQ
jgi:hypothetical protein